LCRESRAPFLKQVETFPDGEVLFDHCNKFGFDGVVSKRWASGYASGPSRHGVKTKCPDRKRDNAERWKIFNQPEQTERQRALVGSVSSQFRPALKNSYARSAQGLPDGALGPACEKCHTTISFKRELASQ
jgi:hypothetical protein